MKDHPLLRQKLDAAEERRDKLLAREIEHGDKSRRSEVAEEPPAAAPSKRDPLERVGL